MPQLKEEQIVNQATPKESRDQIAVQGNNVSPKSEETQAGAAGNKGTQKNVRVLAVFDGESFRSGQVLINDNLVSTIKELSQNILAVHEYRVSIEGHTDNIPIMPSPGKQYRDNMDLSFLRAKTIARILTEKGVAEDRISVIGYGDTRPIASNETEEGRARNRRVEVKLIPANKEL